MGNKTPKRAQSSKRIQEREQAQRPVFEQLNKGYFEREEDQEYQYRNYGGWPPSLMFKRYQTIDRAQLTACEKFARDFHIAGMMPRASLLGMPGGGQGEMSEKAVIATKEWRDAYAAIDGVSCQRVAVDIICHGWSSIDIERGKPEGQGIMQFTRLDRKIWEKREVITRLFVSACTDLVTHYKI